MRRGPVGGVIVTPPVMQSTYGGDIVCAGDKVGDAASRGT
jgi:hypothetical protein